MAHSRGKEHVPNATDRGTIPFILVTAGLALAIFCVALDNTIIVTAIPRITDEFSSIDDIGWYGSAYLLTSCAFQLSFGKVYAFFSLRWSFLGAIFVFELGSVICGAAPTSTCLIVGRAIAGIGTAGIFSGALIIIADTIPLGKRPAYTGLLGCTYGIASIAGPLVGGILTDHVTWRWCFFVNLPIGAVTVVFLLLFYRPNAPPRMRRRSGVWDAIKQFDPLGTFLLVPLVVSLLLILQLVGSGVEWSDGRIITLWVFFGLLLLGFIAVEGRARDSDAIIPPSMLRNRTVAATAWFSFCLGAAFFIMVYFIPIWFQAVQEVSATQSGIRSVPLLASFIAACLLSGVGTTLSGWYHPFILLSAALTSVGAGLMTTWRVESDPAVWIGFQVLFGIGAGCGMLQALMAVQNVVPVDMVPTAVALIMFSQSLGAAIFVSVAQSLFTSRLREALTSAFLGINLQPSLQVGAADPRAMLPEALRQIVRQIGNDAVSRTFTVALVLACLSLLGAASIEWRKLRVDTMRMLS